jgi:hypothetical protein
MKKTIIIIVLLLALPSLCFAGSLQEKQMAVIAKKNTTTVDPCSCPTSTYMACYTGDHASGADYLCYSSGSAADASSNTADTVNSSYVEYNAVDENLCWTVSGDDKISDTQGTMFFTYTTPATLSGSNLLFEAYTDSNDNIVVYYYHTGTTIRVSHLGSGTNQTISGAGSAITTSTSYRIGYTWKTGDPGGHKISIVALGNDPSWSAEADSNLLVAFTDQPNRMCIGEAGAASAGYNIADTTRIANLVITSGYGDDDPLQ